MAAIFVALLLVLPPFSSQPASAAAPALQIMIQSSGDSAIGTDVTFAAHVDWSGDAEELEPPDGWYVNFHGTADGGWDSGPIQAVNHEARYTRTSPKVQTETVTATIANTGCTAGATASATVTHRWWQPTITLDQENVSTPTSGTFQLTGTVTRDGTDPVANADVTVQISRYETNGANTTGSFGSTTSETDTTNAAGRFSVQWSPPPVVEGPIPPAIEYVAVRATADDGDFVARTVTSHTWTADMAPVTAFTLTVPDGADDEVRVGDRVIATADYPTSVPTTSPSDFGFATDQGWQNPNPPTAPATTTGTSSWNYAGIAPNPAWGVLGARWSTFGPHASHATYWYQPQITFREPNSYSANFDTYRASVIVTDGRGEPIPNFSVTFYDGEDQIGTDDTNADGIATSDPLIRFDVDLEITARETTVPSGNFEAVADTNHSWVSTPLGLNLQLTNTSEGFESRVGTNETFQAHLDFASEGADNLQGWDVRFATDGQPIGTRVTNSNGNASISTTRTTQSFSSITATVNISGCGPITRYAYHEWWQPVVDLNPQATVSLAGGSQTFTAELSRPPFSDFGSDSVAEVKNKTQLAQLRLKAEAAEKKIQKQAEQVHAAAAPGWEVLTGRLIRFTLTSTRCELPVAVREATTNEDGVATASFTRGGPTVDRVRASEVGVTAPQSDTTTHTWAEPPDSPLSIDLTQSSTKSQVGSTVTFRAKVRDSRRSNGLAAPGTEVVFHGIDPNRTRNTNSEGVAELDFTGSGTSPDTLTATTAYGCGVVESDPVTHEWERPATEPSQSPTPTITPTITITIVPTPVITVPPTEEPTPEEPTPDEPDEPSEPTPTPTPTNGLPATSKLVDGPEVGRPGADIEISGAGCKAGESLTVSLGQTQLGQTQAAADGTFYVRAVVPDLPLGRYVINSSCGKTIGDPNVDITSPQVDKARAGIAAAGLTTASTFLFFVLLAKGVISFLPRQPN